MASSAKSRALCFPLGTAVNLTDYLFHSFGLIDWFTVFYITLLISRKKYKVPLRNKETNCQ